MSNKIILPERSTLPAFEKVLSGVTSKTIVLYFYGKSCAYCPSVTKSLTKISSELSSDQFLLIVIDDSSFQIFEQFSVRAVPTIIILSNDHSPSGFPSVHERIVGFSTYQHLLTKIRDASS